MKQQAAEMKKETDQRFEAMQKEMTMLLVDLSQLQRVTVDQMSKLMKMQTQAATQVQVMVNTLATPFDQMMTRMAVYETLQAVTAAAALTIETDEAVIEPQIISTVMWQIGNTLYVISSGSSSSNLIY
jgi:ABC-type transporter Mla MlaB component